MIVLNAIFWLSLVVGLGVGVYDDLMNWRSPTVGHPLLGSLWRRRKGHLGGGPRPGTGTLRNGPGR